ncbi:MULTISPECIES: peroxiredoxin-like family protein [unclassified Pseudomonas]|uniref:peroxiredoxin-like family protein n=1 Tax=unclassified Pseudomonas TaxID=196821 RepID=UPI0019148A40|nr:MULTISPECIES: peroxiredoxin-like family protein [unclassified Pseudomonas]MBK5552007.1 AhpC/TSA family protein [Pseudomonas sp. TH03]MEB0227664.1 peroxiredoxin-like family protein [Pseudomonas sp. 5S1]MEB0295184.1 peroxiredoxin-like family protein [Pseudomonas sp. 10S4]WPX16792.1 peroxiredoxin-like family protein [Pseudomonas sp. 10S4]
MSESLNSLLADLHAQRLATWEPAALQVNIDQRQRLVNEARVEDFVNAGDSLEPFTLLKVEGGSLSRDELLANGPAVLIFFRFAGCPACNIALPYYQRRLYPQLHALGVPLVAVSPQVPERLIEIKTRHNLELQVASDPDNQLGRRLGILYSFDEASRNASLAKGNGIGETTGTGTWELPQPTLVVIARDGTVAFAEVSPDWLVRTEADPVLRAVEQLLGQTPLQLAI